jgi:hypothetical protein
MSRVNLALPGNKVVRRKIVRDRSVNVNNVSAKNRAVAGNKGAEASRADDNPGCLRFTSGGRRLPPFFIYIVGWKKN